MAAWLTLPACVLGMNLYAVVLILLRSAVYRTRLYRPMLLNVGLSLVPVLLALTLLIGALLVAQGLEALDEVAGPALLWSFIAVTAVPWLLFFPNSVYLITELNQSHRRADDPVPLWFDIVSTLTLCLSGIVNAMASLSIVQFFGFLIFDDPNVVEPLPPVRSWLVATVVIVLGAVGIYLGRYLRFNSWDVRHPASMLRKSRTYFGEPGRVADFVGFVITHALLILLLYVPVFAVAYALLLGGTP